MATSNNAIALFSITSSALVAIFGIVTPLWIHTSDRKSAQKLRIADKREPVYVQLAQLMGMVRDHQSEQAKQVGEEILGTMTIWTSEEVRALFIAWLDIYPTSLGPDKNPEQDKKVLEASEALRAQLTKEIQHLTISKNG